MNPTQAAARKAGLLYFVMGITAPIGLMYVPGKLIVYGDAPIIFWLLLWGATQPRPATPAAPLRS